METKIERLEKIKYRLSFIENHASIYNIEEIRKTTYSEFNFEDSLKTGQNKGQYFFDLKDIIDDYLINLLDESSSTKSKQNYYNEVVSRLRYAVASELANLKTSS